MDSDEVEIRGVCLWRKGPWTAEEDRLLMEYVNLHGEGRWNNVFRLAGLKRNGKSCRLRWVNYLRPDLKRGQITPHEEKIILELHARWGNRWSTIARNLPGRTDNEIKNYWRTHFMKKGKPFNQSPEKARARLMRKQQFQLMQQQYHHQQQQKQQQEEDQVDMKKMMLFLDESDNKVRAFTHFRQEIVHPSMQDEQSFLYSIVNDYGAVPDASSPSEDTVIWDDGLWNMEDMNENKITQRPYFSQTLASKLSP